MTALNSYQDKLGNHVHKAVTLVSFAAVIRVGSTDPPHQRLLTRALHSFPQLNWPIRSRLPFSGNLVLGGKCNEKYERLVGC